MAKKAAKKVAKKKAKKKAKRKITRKYLVFIDTNIFLDAYRTRSNAGISLLDHLTAVSDYIITSYQVEMEYKKNRQKVLLSAMNEMKPPGKIITPPFLRGNATLKAMRGHINKASEQIGRVKKGLRKMLETANSDPVYKTAQKVFQNHTEYNLHRDNPKTRDERSRIRRLAIKRFKLGYPPRKDNSLSIGDAVNWEWIVHCCKQTDRHAIIVSRDSDFGVVSDGHYHLNDWLLEEFRDRLSPLRQISLTASLSDALKLMNVTVTKEEKEAEQRVIASNVLDLGEFAKATGSRAKKAMEQLVPGTIFVNKLFEILLAGHEIGHSAGKADDAEKQ